MAAFVLGIVSIPVLVVGIVTGVLAILLGNKAQRHVRSSQGRLQGEGIAKAGVVLGAIGIAISLFVGLAGVVFILVSNLGEDTLLVDEARTIPSYDSLGYGFIVYAPAASVKFSVTTEGGDDVQVGLYPVEDAADPFPTSFARGFYDETGQDLAGVVTVSRGSYSLLITCLADSRCAVHYRIDLLEADTSESEEGLAEELLSGDTITVAIPDYDDLSYRYRDYFLHPFTVVSDGTTVSYALSEASGRLVEAGLYRINSADIPSAQVAESWATASGSRATGSAELDAGAYGLKLDCLAERCSVSFGVAIVPPKGADLTPECAGPVIKAEDSQAIRLPDWRPATPAGTSATLVRENDPQSGSWNRTVTPDDSEFHVYQRGNRLVVSITGDEDLHWNFAMPRACPIVAKGFFDDVQRYPFHNEVKGGLDGGPCNKLVGAFSIDHAAYTPEGTLDEVELRFEQRCVDDQGQASEEITAGHLAWSFEGG